MSELPKKPKIEIPDDFEDEATFLTNMREDFAADLEADRDNRNAMEDDSNFAVGNQWDPVVVARREAANKPVMTVNRLLAFIAQIVGNRRLNETTTKVAADNGGTAGVARVREGLMRNIQKEARAERAFDKALECQVTCGLGNFQIDVEWENDDVFERKIVYTELPDSLAVVWDRTLVEPTGADARHVSVFETMPKKEFKRRWPWATPADLLNDATLLANLRRDGWYGQDDVRVVNYWRMRTAKRTLALMTDGSTRDVTDAEQEDLSEVAQRADGSPIMREVNRKFAEMYLVTGLDVLEGPLRLPIKRVPVFRVPGWEMNVGPKKHRWGLVRFLKDPQRLHNYWRSVLAEKIMQSPRAVWMASHTAVQGREDEWRNSHQSDNPLLVYNDEAAQKPERMPPVQIENALLEQAQITTQDMKDVSNIHEANLGMPSNEVSGAAIIARQRVSDTGTIIYHDNLTLAIEEAGKVVNDLIPVIYDTPRIVKTMGIDGKQDMAVINAMNPNSIDITAGKYSVTVTTGPSFATKRIEAAQNMLNLINAMPQTAALIADLIVEAQDWPNSEKIATRLRATMPPQVLTPDEMTPEQQQAAQAAGQKQNKQEAIQDAAMRVELAKKQSETTLNAARAHNFVVTADVAQAREQTNATDVASKSADRELRGSLEAISTAHNNGR